MSEIELRKDYLQAETIETFYFGGGTPSVLSGSELRGLTEKVITTFKIASGPEITIEANPDDITEEKLNQWQEAGINRLSIGIQSFFDNDLLWMNRAHNSEQAAKSLELAIGHFDNISVDLIYGTPLLTNEHWKFNIDRIIGYGVPHLSCYALTVEPKTPLHRMIREKKTADIDPEKQSDQFLYLMERMERAGYEHYEISNFANEGFRSRHNSSYWCAGKKYLGIGPSAHSFDGRSRQWNIANNTVYIDSLKKGTVPFEKEILTPVQKVNEYIMTSLRTMEGMDLKKVEDETTSNELREESRKFIERGLMWEEQDHLKLTRQGKLLADGIAAELFRDS